MAKTQDPLIRIAKELANLPIEDAIRAVNISKELRMLYPQPVPPTPKLPPLPPKRRGRKPGSKNKKKELDKTFPKDKEVQQDSGLSS